VFFFSSIILAAATGITDLIPVTGDLFGVPNSGPPCSSCPMAPQPIEGTYLAANTSGIFLVGFAAGIAWQSYGDAARKTIASWSPHLAWLAPATVPSGGSAERFKAVSLGPHIGAAEPPQALYRD
jgi:hypothetical protein